MDYSSTMLEDIAKQIQSISMRDTVDQSLGSKLQHSIIPKDLFELLEKGVELYPEMSDIAEGYYKVITGLSKFQDLDEEVYWYVCKLLLYLEHYQGLVDMRQYNLYNQTIIPSTNRPEEFLIKVPGLSEDRPSLRPRDTLEIFQVNGVNYSRAEITFVGKDYISVKVSAGFLNRFKKDQKFNIEFIFPDWLTHSQNYILNQVHKYKLSPMLFPTGNSELKTRNNEPIEWINTNIKKNREQQQAIRNILNKTAKPAPYILFGPPGTGKTSTLVEAICQIMKKNSSTNILICTPSNAAADEIALRLIKNSIHESNLHRMYSSSKSGDEISDNIKRFSNIIDNQSIFISKEVFLTKKIVITTLTTCIRLHNYELRENHFSYLFVDEAGQATELETLIPLVLLKGEDSNSVGTFCGQIVIAGDPKQLGPVIQSHLAKPLLSISMLERLMNWGPYKKNKDNKYDQYYVTKLVQNYRCHKAILHLPNKLFYDNDLVAMGGEHTMRAVNWPFLPKKNFPVIFHAVRGKESRDDYSPSVFNSTEIAVVVKYVEKLLKSNFNGKKINQSDIGVITPYKLQRKRLHQCLDSHNIKDVGVGTVEIFQGQERDVIIISTVRSVLYKNNENIHIGFLSHPKRFNVAITRAKALLIVVGNPDILQYDVNWRSFIQYCIDNQACTGEHFVLKKSTKYSDIKKLIGKKHFVCKELQTNSIIEEEPINTAIVKSPIEDRRRRFPIGYISREPINKEEENIMEKNQLENIYNQQYFMMEENHSDTDDSDNNSYYHDYHERSENENESSDDGLSEINSDDSDNSDFDLFKISNKKDIVLEKLLDKMQQLKINSI